MTAINGQLIEKLLFLLKGFQAIVGDPILIIHFATWIRIVRCSIDYIHRSLPEITREVW